MKTSYFRKSARRQARPELDDAFCVGDLVGQAGATWFLNFFSQELGSSPFKVVEFPRGIGYEPGEGGETYGVRYPRALYVSLASLG